MSTATAALLLAEHEPETCGLLERHLAEDGFDVVRATDSGEVLKLAETARPDLVLLGAALPGSTAVELCRRLREGEPGRTWDRDVPLIVLGPDEADATDRVRAFDRGADDYVARPFVYEELLARIRAVLRRTAPPAAQRYEAGDLVVDRVTRSVELRGEPVRLTYVEFEILSTLARSPGRVFSRGMLLERLWGDSAYRDPRTIDVHIRHLREKLERDPKAPEYIFTVRGVGYRFREA